ncbi:MAG TPA: hypothetical protein VJA23_00545 [Candidatus Nanoarchaeia archaeon]|nr:hypothetical protein [Candidatus Nanoarchaeia archaeon]
MEDQITYDSGETKASSAVYYIESDETGLAREKSESSALPITPEYPLSEIERQRKLFGEN